VHAPANGPGGAAGAAAPDLDLTWTAHSDDMRILAVVPSLYNTSPGQRFRIEQWAPRLRAHGIDVEFAPFEDAALHDVLHQPGRSVEKAMQIGRALARRVSVVAHARRFDAVYLFREAALLGPAVLERWMGRRLPVVFDFDDAIFERYRSPTNGYFSWLKFPGKTAATCRLSGHVIVGNPYLADYARQFSRSVTIVPTTIDTDIYRPSPAAARRVTVIGWSGSHSTVRHLRTLDAALRRLARRLAFQLRVIGAPGYSLDGVDVELRPWRADTEVADFTGVDVGIMPLPDDRWSRGKCGLKALQYMALGIPAVCSPVGVNRDIISHGQNGLLAASTDDWVAELERLLASDALRQRLGAAGRATVEARYSAAAQIPVVRRVFEQAVARRPSNGIRSGSAA
jgi:glycosyltransferase involved in cell wall biosynthesis